MLRRYLRPALSLTVFMTLLLGVVYPVFITAVGRAAFPAQASGSLLHAGDTLIGSRLIGQSFRTRATSGADRRPRRRSPTTAWPRAARTWAP